MAPTHEHRVRFGEEKASESAPVFDIFLATPMSGFGNDAEYRCHRERVLEVIELLRREPGLERIYFAGQQIESVQGFEPHDEALLTDLAALRNSRIFCLLYPKKLVSSVLLETGMAMALGKPCVLLARRREDLPYLLISAEALGERGGLPAIRIFEYGESHELTARLGEQAGELFRLAS